MGLAVREVYRCTLPLLGGHDYLATVAAMLAGLLAYPVLAVLLGGIRPGDLKGLPAVGPRAAGLVAAYENRKDRLLSRIKSS